MPNKTLQLTVHSLRSLPAAERGRYAESERCFARTEGEFVVAAKWRRKFNADTTSVHSQLFIALRRGFRRETVIRNLFECFFGGYRE